MQEYVKKAAVLLEALPYIKRYAGARFVIKYGGSFMDSPDPAVRAGVAQDIVFLQTVGIRPVVVHGGGKAITKAMEVSGLKPEFVQGLRITDRATAQLVDEVLSKQINAEIVEYIQKMGGRAIGIPGPRILRAKRKKVQLGERVVDIGFVGDIVEVDTATIWEYLEQGFTPVISPTALGIDDGEIYNCNADLAAARVAITLRARRLVFMSDVPGLLRDPKDPGSLISVLKIDEVDRLKQSGVIAGGMIPKVDSAVEAIRSGVEKVSFVDGRIPHAILLEIFTDQGVGTELSA